MEIIFSLPIVFWISISLFSSSVKIPNRNSRQYQPKKVMTLNRHLFFFFFEIICDLWWFHKNILRRCMVVFFTLLRCVVPLLDVQLSNVIYPTIIRIAWMRRDWFMFSQRAIIWKNFPTNNFYDARTSLSIN